MIKEIKSPEEIVKEIIAEYKIKGSIFSSELFDRFDKYDMTTSEMEDIFAKLESENIKVIEEIEKNNE